MGDLSANFSRHEFACKCGCGFDTVDNKLIQILEIIRGHFDRPIKINSGCRCPDHNKTVGGAGLTPGEKWPQQSQHVLGRAADIVIQGVNPQLVGEAAAQAGASGIKVYSTFTHVDSRTGPVWHDGLA